MNRIVDAALHPTCNNRSRSGDAENGPAVAVSQPDGDSPLAAICRSATTLRGIAGSTTPVSCGICTETEEMTRGTSNEAIMLVPHSQRVGFCRTRAERSRARPARLRSKLTTMT